MVETLSKNITRQGLTATTLNYLRVSGESSSQGRITELPLEGGESRGAVRLLALLEGLNNDRPDHGRCLALFQLERAEGGVWCRHVSPFF